MRFGGHLASALAGFLIGGLAALALQSNAQPSRTESIAPERAQPIDVVGAVEAQDGSFLLAWARNGLRPGIAAQLARMHGVRSTTTVLAGLDWIRTTRGPNGGIVDRAARGSAIPVEVAIVDPKEYAPFVPPSERQSVLDLQPGDALLSQTAAELRAGGIGLEMRLDDGRRFNVRGVLSDTAAAGYEIVTTGTTPASWTRADRFVLMRLGEGADRRRIEAKVRRLMPAGTAVRLRAEGETPFLRYGDAVLPLGSIKKVFGEFAARRLSNGYIDIEKAWVKDNIVSARIPLVGAVTCHRILFPQLRAVFEEIIAQGLESQVNREQFGGCYSPRFVDREPTGRLSHHAWGIAIDINVAENAFGTAPDQDPRLVEIFERHGFTWGGRWLVPDGMHFEWVSFPGGA